MLLEFTAPEGLDPARFMEIYREGNEENADYFYPNAEDKAEARRKVEADFLDYLKGKGPFRLCDCVSKRNVASLKTHEKCGFVVATDPGYDYLQKTTEEGCFGMEYRWEG